MFIKRRITASFIAYIVFLILAVYTKMIHNSQAQNFLIMGVIAWLVFTGFALLEVNTSKKINGPEKRRWTLGLIFFGGIVGIIYFFLGRRRIA